MAKKVDLSQAQAGQKSEHNIRKEQIVELKERNRDLVFALEHLINAVDNDMTRKHPDSFPGFMGAIARANAALVATNGKLPTKPPVKTPVKPKPVRKVPVA